MRDGVVIIALLNGWVIGMRSDLIIGVMAVVISAVAIPFIGVDTLADGETIFPTAAKIIIELIGEASYALEMLLSGITGAEPVGTEGDASWMFPMTNDVSSLMS